MIVADAPNAGFIAFDRGESNGTDNHDIAITSATNQRTQKI